MELREFYSKDSGERYFEQLTRAAQTEAANVTSFFYSLAFAHAARKALPELEAARVELQASVDSIRERLAVVDAKMQKARGQELTKLQAEQWQLSTNFTRDSNACQRVEFAIKAINSQREPVVPQWLADFLDTY